MDLCERVVLVAGGGAGIGAAAASYLAAQGYRVVVLDPGVSVEGRQDRVDGPDRTVEAITARGGSAQLIRASVTDDAAVAAAIRDVIDQYGRLDAVVNAAGFDRDVDYRAGAAADWAAVLDVHLLGHVVLLRNALPYMVAAGHGRFAAFTSGAGWRAGHGNAYGCAKRSICSLVWALADHLPEDVSITAVSPIADTRMTHAHARDPAAGVNPDAFPPASHIAPLIGDIVGPSGNRWNGQVLFTDGSEVSRVARPELLEAVEVTTEAELAAVVTDFLEPAESSQASAAGTSARPIRSSETAGPAGTASCAVVVGPRWNGPAAAEIVSRLAARGVRAVPADGDLTGVATGEEFAVAEQRLRDVEPDEGFDSILVVDGSYATDQGEGWKSVLDGYSAVPARLLDLVAWSRAASVRSEQRVIRVVTVLSTGSAADRAAAQAVTQLARGVRRRDGDRLIMTVIADRSAGDVESWSAPGLAVFLLASPRPVLAGAELLASAGWVGLDRHPAVVASATFTGPDVPAWLDAALCGTSV